MPRAKKQVQKTQLLPGTPIHVRRKGGKKTEITVIDYDAKQFHETVPGTVEECFAFKDKPTVTWINIESIHSVEALEKLGACYELHPLVLEDILTPDQRPKLEDYGDYIYIVLKMFYYQDKTGEIITEQISLILGSNFVISFQQGIEGDVFDPIRQRIRNGKGRIRSAGPDYLVYALMDSIVDSYFVLLEKLGERIEFLEEALVTNPTPETLHKIHDLKREMLFLRKSVWPLREVIDAETRRESPLIQDTTTLYLRDVYDHTIQIMDTIETFRDMLSGMLDIYLSSISNRLNEVMKVLTIIATIFIPLTFIAGVYGMNFKYMPELEQRWTYPLLWVIMLSIAVTMLVYFRRKRWL